MRAHAEANELMWVAWVILFEKQDTKCNRTALRVNEYAYIDCASLLITRVVSFPPLL